MATSACVAIGHDEGLYFAVRRHCGGGGGGGCPTSRTMRKQGQIWDPIKVSVTSNPYTERVICNNDSLCRLCVSVYIKQKQQEMNNYDMNSYGMTKMSGSMA